MLHGDEAYESYLGKHVDRHIRLARVLKLLENKFSHSLLEENLDTTICRRI